MEDHHQVMKRQKGKGYPKLGKKEEKDMQQQFTLILSSIDKIQQHQRNTEIKQDDQIGQKEEDIESTLKDDVEILYSTSLQTNEHHQYEQYEQGVKYLQNNKNCNESMRNNQMDNENQEPIETKGSVSFLNKEQRNIIREVSSSSQSDDIEDEEVIVVKQEVNEDEEDYIKVARDDRQQEEPKEKYLKKSIKRKQQFAEEFYDAKTMDLISTDQIIVLKSNQKNRTFCSFDQSKTESTQFPKQTIALHEQDLMNLNQQNSQLEQANSMFIQQVFHQSDNYSSSSKSSPEIIEKNSAERAEESESGPDVMEINFSSSPTHSRSSQQSETSISNQYQIINEEKKIKSTEQKTGETIFYNIEQLDPLEEGQNCESNENKDEKDVLSNPSQNSAEKQNAEQDNLVETYECDEIIFGSGEKIGCIIFNQEKEKSDSVALQNSSYILNGRVVNSSCEETQDESVIQKNVDTEQQKVKPWEKENSCILQDEQLREDDSILIQEQSQPVIIEIKQSLQVDKPIAWIVKGVIILNCLFYGYISKVQILGINACAIRSSYLSIETAFKIYFSQSASRDISCYCQLILLALTFFFNERKYELVINFLFLFKFFVSLWNLKLISTKISNIFDYLVTSWRQIGKVVRSAIFLGMLFYSTGKIFTLFYFGGKQKSIKLDDYVAEIMLKKYPPQEVIEFFNNQIFKIRFTDFAFVFLFLFLFKTFSQNLLCIISNQNQSKYLKKTTPFPTSCGPLGFLKNNNLFSFLIRNKTLYSACQCILIILYYAGEYSVDSYKKYNTPKLQITVQFLSHAWILLPIYEILTDIFLMSCFSKYKNMIYVFVYFYPKQYQILLVIIFFGAVQRIKLLEKFVKIISHILDDCVVITLLNMIASHASNIYFLPHSIQNLSLFPVLFQIFITIPYISTRFSDLSYLTEETQESEEISYFATSSSICCSQDSILSYLQSRSFYIFQQSHPIRIMCFRMIQTQFFKNLQSIIFLTIAIFEICSCFLNEKETQLSQFQQYKFLFEAQVLVVNILICSIAQGFYIGRQSYLQSSMKNLLVILVLLSCYLVQPLLLSSYYIGYIRVLLLLCVDYSPLILKELQQSLTNSFKEVLPMIGISLLLFICSIQPCLSQPFGYVFSELFNLIISGVISIIFYSHLNNCHKNQLLSLNLTNSNNILEIQKQTPQVTCNENDNLKQQQFQFFSWITMIYFAAHSLIFILESTHQIDSSYPITQYLVKSFSLIIFGNISFQLYQFGFRVFWNASLVNKIQCIQMCLISSVFCCGLIFESQERNLLLAEFLLQFPNIIRTSFLHSITVHKKILFQSMIVTLIAVLIHSVIISYLTESKQKSLFLNLILLFNNNPTLFITQQSLTTGSYLSFALILTTGINSLILFIFFSSENNKLKNEDCLKQQFCNNNNNTNNQTISSSEVADPLNSLKSFYGERILDNLEEKFSKELNTI